MIKSMTGFGRAQKEIDGYVITVELKSVNHRYFEFSSRVPRQYGFLDEKLKSYINSKVSRGKIECYVTIDALDTDTADVVVNHTLANAYVKALKEISTEYNLKEDFGASSISRFPEVLVVRKSEDDEELLWSYVKAVCDEAIDRFVAMRTTEGAKMKEDIYSRGQFILDCVGYIEERSPQTVRLRSHIDQLNAFISSDEPVGRKMDFLVQEINRETNTIGSKANDVDIARKVVDIKAEVEKIREQIQNIE